LYRVGKPQIREGSAASAVEGVPNMDLRTGSALIAAYLLGSIPSAYLIAHWPAWISAPLATAT